MARLVGVDVPDEKKLKISLTHIFGIGRQVAIDICQKAKVDPEKRVKQLTRIELSQLQKILESYPIEGTLRRMVRDNIERLKRIGTYRGLRHRMGLPVRGQRTRTNARTNRGRRRTVGAMTKEMAAKLETVKKA